MREQEMDKKEVNISAKGILKRIIRDMAAIKWGLAAAAVLAALIITTSSITPSIIGSTLGSINEYVKGGRVGQILPLIIKSVLFLAALYFANSLFEYLKMLTLNHTVSRYFTCGLRIRISDKIKRLPISFIDRTQYGEVLSTMTEDVSTLGNTVHTIFDLVIMGVIQIIVIATLMFLTEWRLALLIVGVMPVALIVGAFISAKSHKFHRTQRKEQGKLYAHVEETYDNFTTVKAFSIEKRREDGHRVINGALEQAMRKASIIESSIEPFMHLMQAFAFAGICLIGGMVAVRSNMGIDTVAKMIAYAQLFANPIYRVAGAIGNFQRTRAAAERVYRLLEQPEMPVLSGELEPAEGEVEFKDVSFSYVEGTPVIKNLNLKVKKGQKVAIVGPTGGGKTTLVNLLMRFYDLDKGSILLDGQDISMYSRESVRENVGMVLQDTWLFKGTIRNNIGYSNPNAVCAEVEDAAQRAYCDHFIRQLPKGYDTEIDETALNISGGQKQLITIARALLADRPILVLDEATSNVDTRTEALIQKAMDGLTEQRTSFVIAHRLSTIVDADLIIVINNGEIVERGRHEELLAQQGFYYNLYNSQYSI